MAHGDQSTRFEELLQLLTDHGFDDMLEAIQILMNEAMKLERSNALGAVAIFPRKFAAYCEGAGTSRPGPTGQRHPITLHPPARIRGHKSRQRGSGRAILHDGWLSPISFVKAEQPEYPAAGSAGTLRASDLVRCTYRWVST